MEAAKFKTTIKCAGCVAKVTPALNEAVGDGNWAVDINNPAKILTITKEVDAEKIRKAVEGVGFKAEKI